MCVFDATPEVWSAGHNIREFIAGEKGADGVAPDPEPFPKCVTAAGTPLD